MRPDLERIKRKFRDASDADLARVLVEGSDKWREDVLQLAWDEAGRRDLPLSGLREIIAEEDRVEESEREATRLHRISERREIVAKGKSRGFRYVIGFAAVFVFWPMMRRIFGVPWAYVIGLLLLLIVGFHHQLKIIYDVLATDKYDHLKKGHGMPEDGVADPTADVR